MLCASLMDLLPGAAGYYRQAFSPARAALATVSLLCMGMAVGRGAWAGGLPEEFRAPQGDAGRARALRSAAVTGMALLLHNLPEGVLTLFAGVADEQMGLRLSVAVALHNLPEGIAVALPLYYATRSRPKAALAALASGLAEPTGALLAYFFLHELAQRGLLERAHDPDRRHHDLGQPGRALARGPGLWQAQGGGPGNGRRHPADDPWNCTAFVIYYHLNCSAKKGPKTRGRGGKRQEGMAWESVGGGRLPW